MEIRVYTFDEIARKYPRLYAAVFARPPAPSDHPSFVAVGREEGELVGFMSGYATDEVTLYIQRIGFLSAFRGQGLAMVMWAMVADFLRRDGYRYLTGAMRTDNPAALVSALKAGARIHGYKTDTRGVGYALVMLDMKEDEA